MSLVVDLLSSNDADEYEAWICEIETVLLYASFRFRSFLERVLSNSEPIYLVAREHGNLVGAVPAFVQHNHRFGNVLNSLPFFGSNGGIIVDPRSDKADRIRRTLLEGFHDVARQHDAVLATLITNPLVEDESFYETEFGHHFRDERIGQFTQLPREIVTRDDASDVLMASFHQKTRNSIRKGQKGGLTLSHADSPEAMNVLADLHRQNMEAMGGTAKPRRVFEAIRETFTYDTQYRVYLAEKDGIPVSALLVFFHNRTAEYFTPATAAEARSLQPMSVLIFSAMQEAVRRGCRYWNWGGTWLSQGNVYFFKSRWGTEDRKYQYYVREYRGSTAIRNLEAEEILKEYPFFYVLPFSALAKRS